MVDSKQQSQFHRPDPKTLIQLNNNLSEMKAMTEAVRQLLDQQVNKPVVTDWLETGR